MTIPTALKTLDHAHQRHGIVVRVGVAARKQVANLTLEFGFALLALQYNGPLVVIMGIYGDLEAQGLQNLAEHIPSNAVARLMMNFAGLAPLLLAVRFVKAPTR